MRYFPLYEAKMFHQFDHRWAEFGSAGSEVDQLGGPDEEDPSDPGHDEGEEDAAASGSADLQTRRLTDLQKQDPRYLPTPRYWVSEADVLMRAVPLTREEKKELEAMDPERVVERLRPRAPKWLVAFRDIARSTDERTAIFSVLPLVGCGNNAPILDLALDSKTAAFLPSIMSSLVTDFMTRCKLGGTHLNAFYLYQCACLAPDQLPPSPTRDRLERGHIELVYTSEHLRPLAEEVCKSLGWEVGKSGDPEPTDLPTSQPIQPFPFDEDRRALLRAQLDALVARLYGLNRKQLRYILCPQGLSGAELEDVNDGREDPTCAGPHSLPAEPAHDFPGETFRVLKEKEEKRYGEYRTRRLVLEAWDRLWTELGPVEPLPVRFGGSEQPVDVQTDEPTYVESGRLLDVPISTGLFAEPPTSLGSQPTVRAVSPVAPTPSRPVVAEAEIDEREDAEEEPFALVSPEPEPLAPLKDKEGRVLRVRVLSASGQEIVAAGTVVARHEQGKAVLWSVLPDGGRSARKFQAPPAIIELLKSE